MAITALAMKRINAEKAADATSIVPAAMTAIAMKSINAVINVLAIRVKKMTGGQNFSKHPNHEAELPRLNRILGQLEGVKKMIAENRYCPEILIQLKAVRSAIRAVEGNILNRHLQSCVAQSFDSEEDKAEKIAELKMLFDRFEE